MKKFIFIFLMIFGFVTFSHAQIQYYKTTSFAEAKIYNGKYYWGDWQPSDMVLTINLNTDVITIYSPKTQIYKVYKTGDAFTDNKGGRQVTFYVIDQDYDKGTVRLRIESNGNSQVYIDFLNCAWCYNVIRTS